MLSESSTFFLSVLSIADIIWWTSGMSPRKRRELRELRLIHEAGSLWAGTCVSYLLIQCQSRTPSQHFKQRFKKHLGVIKGGGSFEFCSTWLGDSWVTWDGWNWPKELQGLDAVLVDPASWIDISWQGSGFLNREEMFKICCLAYIPKRRFGTYRILAA